jgi:hypothetical protein
MATPSNINNASLYELKGITGIRILDIRRSVAHNYGKKSM